MCSKGNLRSCAVRDAMHSADCLIPQFEQPLGQQKLLGQPNLAQPHLQLAYGVHRQGVGGDQRV